MKTSITRTSFYFLRHGQTDWNAQGMLMGGKDMPLNERGIEQAEDTAGALQNHTIRTIAASPLIRARLTAEIAQTVIKAPIVFIDELREASFGILEGDPTLGNYNYRSHVAMWRDGLPIKDAEPYEKFRERARQGINKALTLPGPILIVSHGGVYRTFLQTINNNADAAHNGELFLCIPQEHNNRWVVKSLFKPD